MTSATAGTGSGTSSPLPSDKVSLTANAAKPSPKASAEACFGTPGTSSLASADRAPPVATKAAAGKGAGVGGSGKPKRRGTVHVNLNLDSVPSPLARSKKRPRSASTSSVVGYPSPADSDVVKKTGLRDRKISIYERGKTLRPGEEDLSEVATGEAKKLSRKKSSLYTNIREFVSKALGGAHERAFSIRR
ncbi:hypothetical protein V5799_019110 [Amblyomma americanum]|uniref:Uncharacterized protein n=1 Tax=Amblyomma americanum TaxID=6943 RepID=A0AAQ4EYP7_AMBAM